MKAVEKAAREDVWVPTICAACINTCHVRVRRVDGKVVQIEGNPDSPLMLGRACPKAGAAMMTLYDPSRVKYPMKRTNPKKGRDQDPGWQRISWEEALDTITEKMREALDFDPRTVFLDQGIGNRLNLTAQAVFLFALGHLGDFGRGTAHCGNAEHMLAAAQHGGGWTMPDWEYCRYLIAFGTQCGSGHGHWNNVSMTGALADARAKGMRLVVVDPFLSTLAEKADEWIPIRPGTDGMFALAMLNLLLNDLGIYDREFLKQLTNGPYLAGPDGRFVRDAQARAHVWDLADGRAKTWDDPTLSDPALEGEFEIEGVSCKPAFQLLKDHVLRYTPEEAEKVTTVPAETIRRIAREYGQAASVGSTITLDGKTLPYRPAQVKYSKGAQSHRHSYQIALGLELLNHVVGAVDVPGGSGASSVCFGHPDTGMPKWGVTPGHDGILVAGGAARGYGRYPAPEEVPWPTATQCATELYPVGPGGQASVPILLQPEAFDRPAARVLILVSISQMMGHLDPAVQEEALGKVPFVVNLALHLDETAEMADVVLPDTHFLETWGLPGLAYDLSWYWNHPHMSEWVAPIRQPVVAPANEERPALEVFLELAERLGKRPEYLSLLNFAYGGNALDPKRRYTLVELIDAVFKAQFGPERGVDYMKKHGLVKWPKKVEERYWAAFTKAKAPIYMEHFPATGEMVAQKLREVQLPERFSPDVSDYTALPEWRPCQAYEESRPDFDLYIIYTRHALMAGSSSTTYNNGWLDEVAELLDPYCYYVTINAETARRKGIADGDWICMESASTGHTIKGRARLSICVHPEVVVTSGNGGHWARGLPIASRPGKGVCWEWMLPLDIHNKFCGVSSNPDTCERIKVYKA